MGAQNGYTIPSSSVTSPQTGYVAVTVTGSQPRLFSAMWGAGTVSVAASAVARGIYGPLLESRPSRPGEFGYLGHALGFDAGHCHQWQYRGRFDVVVLDPLVRLARHHHARARPFGQYPLLGNQSEQGDGHELQPAEHLRSPGEYPRSQLGDSDHPEHLGDLAVGHDIPDVASRRLYGWHLNERVLVRDSDLGGDLLYQRRRDQYERLVEHQRQRRHYLQHRRRRDQPERLGQHLPQSDDQRHLRRDHHLPGPVQHRLGHDVGRVQYQQLRDLLFSQRHVDPERQQRRRRHGLAVHRQQAHVLRECGHHGELWQLGREHVRSRVSSSDADRGHGRRT